MSYRVEAPYHGGTERWEYGGEEHRQVQALVECEPFVLEVVRLSRLYDETAENTHLLQLARAAKKLAKQKGEHDV